MEKNIRLLGFKVNKIEFKTNDGIKPNTQFKIIPKIECKMGRKEENLFVNLSVRVNEDISSPVPFNLEVALFGTFKVINEVEQKEMVSEAMETLYPHLRATVASITANCYIPPYVLPLLSGNGIEENKDNYNVN